MSTLFDAIKSFLIQYEGLLQWIAYGSALLAIISLVLLPIYINRLPEDFFRDERYHTAISLFHHPFINTLGLLLVIVGILMLILPGQGVIAMVAGIMVMRFPGKLALIRKIVHYPTVLNSLNWIRRRGNKQPFSL